MIRAVGQATTAFRLGFAAIRGRSGAVHRWALVVASFLGVLVVWSFVALNAVADHREQRLLDRGPVFIADNADNSPAVARWHDRVDYAQDRQFLVIHVAPVTAEASPPPGLSRWPEPGEAFVSDALLAADPHARERYGEFAGLIARDGLLDSTEWLVYTRPRDPGAFDHVDSPTWISHLGQPDSSHRNVSLPGTITPAEPFWLLVVTAVFPAGVFIVIAVRTGAERRDRRLALLDSLGVPLTARAWVLVGEAATPVMAGAVLGAGVAGLTTVVDTPVPGTGFIVWAGDLAGSRWWIPVIWAGVIVGLLGIAALTQIRPAATGQTRPQSVRPQLPYWAQILFPLGLAAAILISTFGAGTVPEFGLPPVVIGFLLAMIVTLAALPGFAAGVVSWLGTRIARFRSPAGLIGGRWLTAQPALTSRLVAAVAVGLGVTSQLAVIATIDVYHRGWVPDAASDEAVVVYARGASDEAREEFVTAIGADRSFEIRAGAGGYVPVLVGGCEDLRAIGDLSTCPAGAVPSADVFSPTAALARGVLFETELVAPSAPPGTEPWGFLVLNQDGSVGVEQIRRAAHHSLPLATAHVVGQLGRAVEPSMAIRIRWMYAAGAFGVLLLVGAGGLAVLSLVGSQARSLGALGGLGAPPDVFARIAWWNVGLPLLATLGGSVALAAFLAFLAVRLRGTGEIPWTFLGVSAVACLLIAVAMSLSAAALTARAAPGWRPTGD